MAKNDRYQSNEGKSAEMATEWTVSSRLDISGAAAAHKSLAERTQYITVYGDLAFYILFDNAATTANSVNNDPIVPITTLTRIKVPRGLGAQGATVYLHITATGSDTTKYCRLVEE